MNTGAIQHITSSASRKAAKKVHFVDVFSYTVTAVLWILCLANLSFLAYYFPNIPVVYSSDVFHLNGFTFLIWAVVTFFSALVSTYDRTYLRGFEYHIRFKLLSLGFVSMVMLLVASNHLLLFLISWLGMGYFMAQLIGVKANSPEANEAKKKAQQNFFFGSFLLAIALLILVQQTQVYTLYGMMNALANVSDMMMLIAGILIIVAAMIQSAIYPFHRWLLSAMTTPTPASALMHAGFVNGSGILLTLFSVVVLSTQSLNLLFIIGGLTAILAQFTKLLQVHVKQKLVCSTIAQMGFMIMQCGLGFFNAAIVHLILHGFYKAYLFLSSGETIANAQPQTPAPLSIKPLQTMAVLIFGVLGTLLFMTLTGKGNSLDTSIFLTLIVTLTVGQLTYNIVKEKSLNLLQKLVFPPVLFVAGVTMYALLYNTVTIILSDMPMIVAPQPLNALHLIFGIVFLVGFFIMKLGVYRKIPWLYVKLLNASQPFKKTVLSHKN